MSVTENPTEPRRGQDEVAYGDGEPITDNVIAEQMGAYVYDEGGEVAVSSSFDVAYMSREEAAILRSLNEGEHVLLEDGSEFVGDKYGGAEMVSGRLSIAAPLLEHIVDHLA